MHRWLEANANIEDPEEEPEEIQQLGHASYPEPL